MWQYLNTCTNLVILGVMSETWLYFMFAVVSWSVSCALCKVWTYEHIFQCITRFMPFQLTWLNPISMIWIIFPIISIYFTHYRNTILQHLGAIKFVTIGVFFWSYQWYRLIWTGDTSNLLPLCFSYFNIGETMQCVILREQTDRGVASIFLLLLFEDSVSVCLFVCLSVWCPSICLSVCLSLHLSI